MVEGEYIQEEALKFRFIDFVKWSIACDYPLGKKFFKLFLVPIPLHHVLILVPEGLDNTG